MKIFARKVGMTHIYDDSAKHISATVLEIVKTVIVGKRTNEKDGYSAYIVGRTGKKGNTKKSFVGQLKGAENISLLREDNVADTGEFAQKDIIDINNIKEGDIFAIKATGKGKGFSGTVKRHGFATGPKTHGSNNYRAPGSIGPTYPQRVIKGRRMAGKMGAGSVTIKNVKILNVDTSSGRVIVGGSVPGPNKSSLILVK